jgi:hypothetical protein
MTKKTTKKNATAANAPIPIRHGDVGLFPLAAVPGDLQEIPFDGGRPILAYGEVTGHKHQLSGGKLHRSTASGKTVLVLDQSETLTHEEHGPLTVPAGAYEVTIAREVDLTGAIRRVAD